MPKLYISFVLVFIESLLIQIFASSNIHKLRDFIKHVYVERRYTGESCGSSLPRIKMVTCIYPSTSIIMN